MKESSEFLESIINSMTDHIAVIDEQGQIVYVNRSWQQFSDINACVETTAWQQMNYLSVCDAAAKFGDDFGEQASQGIRAVIHQQQDEFSLEYPCHSPDQPHWFIMRVTPFVYAERRYLVIAHQDVTERKLAEQKVESMAHIDVLTEIANRRAFESVLESQWQACGELEGPLCLAFIDLDHFKILNDTYGHSIGDDCLSQFAQLLQQYSQGEDRFCARCGGEEFALIWRNTSLASAASLLNELRAALREMALANEHSPVVPYLTFSAGLGETVPTPGSSSTQFFRQVDALLYQAKSAGRDQMSSSVIR